MADAAIDPDARAAALRYLSLGWSVAPMQPRGKRPLVRWTTYQGRRATAGEVEQWFRRWPDANVGIVTGAVSGLLVLDVDVARRRREPGRTRRELRRSSPRSRPDGWRRAPPVLQHYGEPIPNRAGFREGPDPRGAAWSSPPSIHPNGGRIAARGRGPERWRGADAAVAAAGLTDPPRTLAPLPTGVGWSAKASPKAQRDDRVAGGHLLCTRSIRRLELRSAGTGSAAARRCLTTRSRRRWLHRAHARARDAGTPRARQPPHANRRDPGRFTRRSPPRRPRARRMRVPLRIGRLPARAPRHFALGALAKACRFVADKAATGGGGDTTSAFLSADNAPPARLARCAVVDEARSDLAAGADLLPEFTQALAILAAGRCRWSVAAASAASTARGWSSASHFDETLIAAARSPGARAP